MKTTPTIAFLFAFILGFHGCSKEGPDPDPQESENVEDISTSAEITPYGGGIELSDESGNKVTVTFPPAALVDTTTITVTIQGQHREIPVEKRSLRTIEILPAGLILYKPLALTITYAEDPGDIQQCALFRLHSDEWLTPLGEHVYPSGTHSISAEAWFTGEFSEGAMNLDQVNAQLNLLIGSKGIDWKGTAPAIHVIPGQSSDCELYKAAWDDWTETAAAFFKFFTLRELLGYYDDHEGSFEEDVNKVCENIVQQGINDVLDLGAPTDPCCPEYAQTMETMMQAAINCGVDGTTLDRMNDAYDNVHSQCHTVLDISIEVNIESGGLLIMTAGEVIVTLTGTGDGEASVTGTGELTVTGSGDAGGQCSSTISGQTFATVTGTRDAAYVYSLSVSMNQVAMMVTVCPDRVIETPLVGGSVRELELGPGNSFSISETENIDEGTATVTATLQNPYIQVPDPQ